MPVFCQLFQPLCREVGEHLLIGAPWRPIMPSGLKTPTGRGVAQGFILVSFFRKSGAGGAGYVVNGHDLSRPPLIALIFPRRKGLDSNDGKTHKLGRYTAKQKSWRGAESSGDRKSTRLNSSHVRISYAVFC